MKGAENEKGGEEKEVKKSTQFLSAEWQWYGKENVQTEAGETHSKITYMWSKSTKI